MAVRLDGFRAGLDSVLLGAAVSVTEGAQLDLGAGVGTATLVALTDRPGLAATLVESNPEAGVLAKANLKDNGFVGRGDVLDLDIASAGRARTAAGLPPDYFTAVIANPPFYESGNGTSATEERRAARFTGGLSVFTFLRIRSWMSVEDCAAAATLAEDAGWFARIEGLEGHARAAARRIPASAAGVGK